MDKKQVVLIVDVPEESWDVIALALADILSGVLRLDGRDWHVRVGGSEMLAPPVPDAEPTKMDCGLSKQCRKHPAFEVSWLTAARADCPHFVAGGSLDEGHKPQIGSPHNDAPPRRAFVTGGWCICAAYDPANPAPSAPDAT
jgi:hypothetical protein